MRVHKILSKLIVLLVIGGIISFIHRDFILAFVTFYTVGVNCNEKVILDKNTLDTIQSFEGESLPDEQWNEEIPVYKQKKKVSKKAITTNLYSGKYGYQTLKYEEQKKVYKILEEAADAFHNSNENAVEASSSGTSNETKRYIAIAVEIDKTITASMIGEVVVSLIYDHPDYFWSQGYSYYLDSNSKDAWVTRVTLACHKDYVDGVKRAELWKEMTKEVEEYMDLVVGISSDYEKELILHDAIAERITYAYDEKHVANQERWAHTIEGVFSKKYYSAVCEGYAKAFQLLLNAAGIENVYVVGNSNGQGHAWNQVKIGEDWYNVDLTWNDTNDRKSYRYFNLNDDVFDRNHAPFPNEYEVTPKVGEWSYLVNPCVSEQYSYVNMGETKENPSCKVGLGKIKGAGVTILNHGVIVASGNALTNSSINSGDEVQKENWVTVTPGTKLTVQIVPDYTMGEVLLVTTALNGEETTFSGIGGDEISYTIAPDEDCTLEVSVYVPVQGVRLNKNKCEINGIGKTEILKADIIPPKATNTDITWISSRPSVAEVKEGVVTSVGAGTTTIYAYLEDKTVVAECIVTVKLPNEVPVYVSAQEIRLNKNKCNITGTKKTVTLLASIIPPTATNTDITWISSKPSVAKVKEGVVTSVGAGTAKIYAYLENKTVAAECIVTVKVPRLKIISKKRSVRKGKILNMKAKLYDTTGSIRWSVSNKNVAVIGVKNGRLKGKKQGVVWVTAKKGKITARVKITVYSKG